MADSPISIVLPAFNAGQFIRRTIESIRAQSHRDWELLVVDDCSTDDTVKVVGELAKQDARIRLIALTRNFGGPAGPRNIGVSAAQGEWIAMMDADDIWHPRKLEFQIKHLASTGAAFCSTKMLDFCRDDEIRFQPVETISVEAITFSQQLRKNRTPNSSVVVRRSLLLACPFNEDLRYKATEDLDCWLRIHERIGSSIKLSFPFLHYRRSANQISGSKLKMLRRKFFVLGQYRLQSGVPLGWRKYFYIFAYINYSIYYRLLKRSL